MRLFAAVLLLFVAGFAQGVGGDQPKSKKNAPTVSGAPIPEKVLAAKTVLLLVTAEKQEYYYKIAYKYLADWDRWKIVTDPKEADLILHISDRSEGTVVASGSSATAGFLGIPLHHYYLTVIDRETGDKMWATDTDDRALQSYNAKRLLKKLQQRISEAEKTRLIAPHSESKGKQ